jgi:cysteinyl-tRNA synthetase
VEFKLHNTLTRSKEVFTPLDPKNVRMYVCGPTVYDFAHIGNARPVIVFDVLFRLLRHVYGADHVTYVRNITDVDDKINARAAEDFPGMPLNEAIARVTSETTRQFHEDIKALGVLEPTVEPACTDHIKQMIAMIDVLESKGYAYEAEGHMLLDTSQIPNYGQLSGRSLDEMIAGARVEVAPYKRNPADSVLWKPSTNEQPGWDSPWGRGRPGWHIECSAMAKAHLGDVFDIHGGGIDLTFPHHENELAQSTCALDTKQMAQIWMHNGYLQVEGRKMSKSEGNFVTINELLTGWQGVRWPGAVLRLAMLSTHYRQPIDWTHERLKEAGAKLMRIREFSYDDGVTQPSQKVLKALADDLNTPKALTEIFKLLEDSKNNPMQGENGPRAVLGATCRFLGLDLENVTAQHMFQRPDGEKIDAEKVQNLITARNAARVAKDWAEADRIRDELEDMGVVLKDGPEGTTWEIKR